MISSMRFLRIHGTTAFISGATWNALARRYNEKQLIDVVMAIGEYNMVSMFLNTPGAQLEKGVAGFPKGKDKQAIGQKYKMAVEPSQY
jgi:hypothetical protein